MGLAVNPLATDERREDEAMAARSDAPLLITADTRHDVERLARRIHQTGPRAMGPFVPIRVRAWPDTARTIRKRWSAVFEAACGGSVFLTGIEELSPAFQTVLVDLIDDRQRAQSPWTAARLISGTTVSLLDCVKAGAFSERLFYRLNVIHIVLGHGAFRIASPATEALIVPAAQAR